MIFRKLYQVSFLSVLTFVFALFVSCTDAKPEITYGYLQLILYQGEKGPQERYSFFVIPSDDDGLDNLSELYLYHDREQLRWEIKSNEWVTHTQEGKTWIGTRSISVREGSLPRGVFRAVLVNKGGERAERNFTFDGVVRFPFPELEINKGVYTVNSQWTVNKLICYDSSGNYLSTVQLSALSGNVSQLNFPSNARTAALWAEDDLNFCSAFTNAVPLN